MLEPQLEKHRTGKTEGSTAPEERVSSTVGGLKLVPVPCMEHSLQPATRVIDGLQPSTSVFIRSSDRPRERRGNNSIRSDQYRRVGWACVS